MSLLKKAMVEQAAAKIGGFGPQGSGKSLTLALLAIALSKMHHKGAPVAMFATEPGVDFLVPIFEMEKVELLVIKSRAFKDMCGALREAEESGCCVYDVDSYTHPWKELTDSFRARSKRKRLEMHHMDELKSMWQAWTDQMLGSHLHVLLSGRLGNMWDNEIDEEGERKLVSLGGKMKGETDAGYEPSLLFQMECIDDPALIGRDKKTRLRRSGKVHNLTIVKDRWRSLNGRQFSFKDINEYKPGDWKKVYDVFLPHISKLTIGGTHRGVDGTRTSQALFDREGAEFGKRREISLEEIKESIASVWPGQTAVEKKLRQVTLEHMFGTLAWSKVESMSLHTLETASRVLAELRKQAKDDSELITNEPGVIALVQMCKDHIASEDVENNPAEVPVI